MKHYLKYIIELNKEIMEKFCDFRQKTNRSLNSLSDEQDKLRDEFQEMKTSIQKLEEEAKREEAQNQTLMIKGFDTLVNGMSPHKSADCRYCQ